MAHPPGRNGDERLLLRLEGVARVDRCHAVLVDHLPVSAAGQNHRRQPRPVKLTTQDWDDPPPTPGRVAELEGLTKIDAAASDQLKPRLDRLDRLHGHNLPLAPLAPAHDDLMHATIAFDYPPGALWSCAWRG